MDDSQEQDSKLRNPFAEDAVGSILPPPSFQFSAPVENEKQASEKNRKVFFQGPDVDFIALRPESQFSQRSDESETDGSVEERATTPLLEGASTSVKLTRKNNFHAKKPGVYYGPSRAADEEDTYDDFRYGNAAPFSSTVTIGDGVGSDNQFSPTAIGEGSDSAEDEDSETNFLGTGRRVTYENFSTIDWIHDFAKERLRQKSLRNLAGIKGRFIVTFDAAQAWVLVAVVGMLTGILTAVITVTSEWLGDLKEGYCSAGYYLNKKSCCWYERQSRECADWIPWSQHFGDDARGQHFGASVVNYVAYVGLAVLFACASSVLVKSFAPYAAGSGIPEIKTILSGFVIRKFFGFWTLVVKSIGLSLSTASGLNLGKEGPSVHLACCIGNIFARLFNKYKRNEAKKREVLSAATAAGVSCAFGAPIGGVLFALEEVSYYFPYKTLWRSFFCAMIAAISLEVMNPFHDKKIVLFQVEYSRNYHTFELPFFMLLGAIGGLLGTAFIRLNRNVAHVRKTSRIKSYPVLEVFMVALLTSLVGYLFQFTSVSSTELVANLFRECEEVDYDFNGICDPTQFKDIILLLLLAAVIKSFFTVFTFGILVPAGIFIPSMAVGACLGRAVGILIQVWQTAFPHFVLFRACTIDETCVTPGVYAMIGAAAVLGGITRMTISLAVIMFELTGQMSYVLPTMLTLLTSKWVADAFGNKSVYETLIELNGYPYLESKDDIVDPTAAGKVMTPVAELEAIPCAPLSTLAELKELVEDGGCYNGYPVVESLDQLKLHGFIGRAELRYALFQAQRHMNIPSDARVVFSFTSAANEILRISKVSSTYQASCAIDQPNVILPAQQFDHSLEPLLEVDSSSIAISPTNFIMAQSLPVRSRAHTPVVSSIQTDPTLNTNSSIVDESKLADKDQRFTVGYRLQQTVRADTTFTKTVTLNLEGWLNKTPMVVGYRMPMDMVRDLFAKLGLRYVLVSQNGLLAGILTKKDLLRHEKCVTDFAAYQKFLQRCMASGIAGESRYRARLTPCSNFKSWLFEKYRRATHMRATMHPLVWYLLYGPLALLYFCDWYFPQVCTLSDSAYWEARLASSGAPVALSPSENRRQYQSWRRSLRSRDRRRRLSKFADYRFGATPSQDSVQSASGEVVDSAESTSGKDSRWSNL